MYKRVWNFRVWAVVAILIGSLFISKVSEWSGSEMVVYGQSSTTIAPPSGAATVTKVVPQIVAGSFDALATKYTTIIQIVNPSTETSVTLTATLYNQNGTLSTLEMKTNSPSQPTFTGTLTIVVPRNGVIVLTTNPSNPLTGVTQWGKFVTTAAVTIASSFEIRDGATNTLYGRVGVDASDSNMRQFLVPRPRSASGGMDTGFALVNTGTVAATLTGVLRDENGTILGTHAEVFQPNQQKALFAAAFFASADAPNQQFIVFESPGAQFAAVGLSVEAGILSSLPLTRLE